MDKNGNWISVYHSVSEALALTVREALSKAGYESRIGKVDDTMTHICVEESDFQNAVNLLNVKPKHGEIFNGNPSKKKGSIR